MSPITRALIAAGAIVLVTGSVRADAQVFEPLKFETTFPFTVAHMNFPAGKYTIRPTEMDNNVLQISDGRTTKLLVVEPAGVPSGTPSKVKADDEVFFKKMGDQYVLSEIWDAASQAGVEPIPQANQGGPIAAHQAHHHHSA